MVGKIPIQLNSVDCGVFLLMYSKYLASNQELSFSQNDMSRFRQTIKQEIVNQTIYDIGNKDNENVQETNSNKKKLSVGSSSKGKPEEYNQDQDYSICRTNQTIKVNKTVNEPLKFTNPCATICWLNSLVQLFCLMFESNNTSTSSERSTFLKLLSKFKSLKISQSIQQFRILLTQFDKTLRRHQQDPMEFFGTIQGHRPEDKDPLLKPIKMIKQTYTFCMSNDIHFSEGPVEPHFFIEVEKPPNQDGLQQAIENFFHGGSQVNDWKCSTPNCNKKGGTMKNQILGNEKPEFILVRMARWSYDQETRSYRKSNDPINVPESFTVTDIFKTNIKSVYNTVGVLHHLGSSSKSGHYISEIKLDDQWWTCNDSVITKTTFDQLKHCGYIFLFKRNS